MSDVFTVEKRSRIMASIRGRHTQPELLIRRMLHGLGYRFRLHVRTLPGCPDLVFPSRRKVIFVHGCFWHRHRCPKGFSMPASRPDFWRRKFDANMRRDSEHGRDLRKLGWAVLTVWECQLTVGKLPALTRRIERFLQAESAAAIHC